MTLRPKKKFPVSSANAPDGDDLRRATGALFSTGPQTEPDRLADLARISVAQAAVWCVVDRLDSPSELVRVAVAHRDPARHDEALPSLGPLPFDANGPGAIALALRHRATQVWPPAGAPTVPASFGPAPAGVTIPLVAGESLLGVASFACPDAQRGFGDDDLQRLEELCARAAMAVDHARLQDQIQRARHAQDDLLAIVSHDLRNPLGLIMMSARLLTNPSIGAAAIQKNAERIERATLQMERLIRDLLDLAVIESGHFTVQQQPHRVSILLGEALDLMTPLASGQGLSLSSRAPPAGSPADLAVSCDRARTLQVFSNLIGNAIKFTAKGSITLGAEPAGAEVRFSIDDTGSGIAPEQLPQAFARDWRTSPTVQQGIGLELSIAKGIVLAHRGKIWIESQLGKGSSVRFTLPMA
jgi:signal transduction histidine kinase